MQTHAAHEVQLDFSVRFTSLWRDRKRINHPQNVSLKSWPAPHPGGKVCVATGTAPHSSPSSPGGDAALSPCAGQSALHPLTSAALPPGAPVKPSTASVSLILQESQTVIDT